MHPGYTRPPQELIDQAVFTGEWILAGLAAWGFIHGDVRSVRPGLYGQITCNVRLNHYVEWIESVMSGQPQAGR